ncbi:MAG: FMN-binding glutamate synthase family protein [Deltaproteobacteria bacterium]|nr:FMN-binding glutamate synthase family protein [Deltaproteobacteria bacterium]
MFADFMEVFDPNRLTFYFIALVALALVVIALVDVTQKNHTLRHNFPIVAWARYMLESQREKIQQYFVEMPRDGRPYNLRQRQWIYRSAKALPSATGFGSDAKLEEPGAFFFLNSPFATLETEAPTDAALPKPIGPHRAQPFNAKQFTNISDMSYGSLGRNAVKALAKGASLSGCWLSSGEGALSEHHLSEPCDRMFEIGTAKFGVRELDGSFSLERLKKITSTFNAITVKLSQGAKPGAGGVLPKAKITEEIAQIRNIRRDEDCHSPNRFMEFTDVPSMFAWIRMLQKETGKPVGFKFCLGDRAFALRVAEELAKCKPGDHPDHIILDGSEGGTGAAPVGLADNMGTPIREALPWFDNLLREHGVRDRVRLIASGRFATASEVAYGLALGADYINIARGFLLALGCIQALQCHTNHCPTGITTHDKWLQAGLDPTDKGVRAANYVKALRAELMMIVRACGLKSPAELTRHHVRVMQDNGKSVSLADIWPYPAALSKTA